MTAKKFSEYRGKNVMIDGITFPIVGYEKGFALDFLIVGVSKDIIEKETHTVVDISTAWKTLCDDDVIEKKCDYYSYVLKNTVIL